MMIVNVKFAHLQYNLNSGGRKVDSFMICVCLFKHQKRHYGVNKL